MKILYDDCLDAIKNNRCSGCGDYYQCIVASFLEDKYKQGGNDMLNKLLCEIEKVDDDEFAMFSLGFIKECVDRVKEQLYDN